MGKMIVNPNGCLMDKLQLIAHIKQRIDREAGGNVSLWAATIKISQSYLAHFLVGRDAGPKLLKAIGVRRVTSYEIIPKKRRSTKGE